MNRLRIKKILVLGKIIERGIHQHQVEQENHNSFK